MTKKRKTFLYIIIITLISVYISVIIVNLVKDPRIYIDEINNKHLSIILSYILLCITQTIIPIIPGEPIELLGGYLFGKINGSIICFICEAVASIFVVLLARKYGKKLINYLFSDKKIDSIEKLKSKKYFNLFTILFILPGTPKDLMTYFSGLTDYDLIPTLIIVTIGRLPSIITSTLSASYFQDEKYLISIIIYAITIVICIIDISIYKHISKKK